jgi:hypothetical protein
MPEIIRQINSIGNISSSLYFPGYTKYLSDCPTSPARQNSYSHKEVFTQLKDKNFFTSTNIVTGKFIGSYSPTEHIIFDNEEDVKKYDNIIRSIADKRKFAAQLIRHHSADNIKPIRWFAAPYRRYKVNAPNTRRKMLLEDYKFSVRFGVPNLNYVPSGTIVFDELKRFLWNFYVTENYPVQEYYFQCFCLEYYFNKNDVLNQGIQMYFKTEEDALHFSFKLTSLFSNYLTVF